MCWSVSIQNLHREYRRFFVFSFHIRGCALVLFIFSKLPELADTLFIILKNKRVELIHWFHHVSVMLFCWHALATEYAPGMIFAVMNYGVHSLMYLYFAITTQFVWTRIHLKNVGFVTTCLQTSQMVIGIAVNAYAAYVHTYRKECYIVDSTVRAAVFMYSTYFVLFLRLLLNSWTERRDGTPNLTKTE